MGVVEGDVLGPGLGMAEGVALGRELGWPVGWAARKAHRAARRLEHDHTQTKYDGDKERRAERNRSVAVRAKASAPGLEAATVRLAGWSAVPWVEVKGWPWAGRWERSWESLRGLCSAEMWVRRLEEQWLARSVEAMGWPSVEVLACLTSRHYRFALAPPLPSRFSPVLRLLTRVRQN